jgi:hypothetical protein
MVFRKNPVFTSVPILVFQYEGGYSALVISRKTPTIATTIPATVKIPTKWLMSPAGGLMEEYAMIDPTIMSINPNTFSTTVNPIGISALNPEPSRFNFTLS